MSDDTGLPPDWQNAVEALRHDGWLHAPECIETMAETIRVQNARIARALDALRTAPDLDTAEPSKAVLRRAHTAILTAWAELAAEPPSVRGRAQPEGAQHD